MDRGMAQGLHLSFLDNSEEPEHPQCSYPASQSVPRTASPSSISDAPLTSYTVKSAVARSASNASTRSTASSQSGRNSSTRQNSTSSSISTTSIPPEQQLGMTGGNYGYDLPCEFAVLGCEVKFDPPFFELWISHSLSHFHNAPLPPRAICIFCDTAFSDFRERMMHIRTHLRNLELFEYMRPDYWVIEHMRDYGLLSPEDFANAMEYSERPPLEHTVSLDSQPSPTEEEKRREERQSQEPHDLRKERREIPVMRSKRKGKDSHKGARKVVLISN